MSKTPGAKDIASRIRGAMKEAIRISEERARKGRYFVAPNEHTGAPGVRFKSLEELLIHHLQEDVLGTLKPMSAFIPKELLLQPDHAEGGAGEAPVFAIVIPRKEFLAAPPIEGEVLNREPPLKREEESPIEVWRRRVGRLN